ncbi:MAG: UbiD family decarboxylase [Nitrospinota bacterium]|nr:UbiD family decarboxylase [Nitrospinota bacterium]MDP6619255.1 UbiD family decarboxylase [Nitrospinota bacterium]
MSAAATQDLRGFLRGIEERNPADLLRIREPVSNRFEMTAVALEIERRGNSPILWFEKVEGTEFPVVANVYGTRKRFAQILCVPEEELLDAWVRRDRNPVPPKMLESGPILDSVQTGEDVDLSRLPLITHFHEDAGPYFTAGVIVAKDPDTGVRNGSFHRLQVKGRDRLGTSLHSRRHLWSLQQRIEARGEPLEIAVVIGAHPLFYFGAGLWKGPIQADEYDVAGSFLGEPLEVVRCRTVDLEVPARAEVVLEGRIVPGVREPEGPFAEFTGYASHASTNHVIEVTGVLHRRDALFQDVVSGNAAEHTGLLRVPGECRIYQALKGILPGVRAVSYPPSGACRFHCYISMKKTAEGQAKSAIFAAMGEDLSLKWVVVVDDDVDVYNEEEVMWAVATRMQADRGVFVVPHAMGAILDPSSRNGLTAKVGIDATAPLDGWTAERCTVPEDALRMVRKKLKAWIR